MNIIKNFKFVFILTLLVVMFTVMHVSVKGFFHDPVIVVDGEDFYLAGVPDGPDGATDIPGHEWAQAGKTQLAGKHYNTGPFGVTPQWWSSDAPDGDLLYSVHGIIDTWSIENATR